MTKELIERYLQFWIENWLDIHKWVSEREDFNLWTKDFFLIFYKYSIGLISKHDNSIIFNINIIDIITSWPFIEAITKGYYDKLWGQAETEMENKRTIKDNITRLQAIAIRDNKLDEFIQDLLPKK